MTRIAPVGAPTLLILGDRDSYRCPTWRSSSRSRCPASGHLS